VVRCVSFDSVRQRMTEPSGHFRTVTAGAPRTIRFSYLPYTPIPYQQGFVLQLGMSTFTR